MSKEIVALILAGGKGTRLEALTKKEAKPAVSFAAKFRIIDFPLSNCANSGFDTVGILTQYEAVTLNNYIGNGEKWGLNGVRSLTSILAPHQTEEGANWYRGTADAIYQNIDFLDSLDPQYVLILSGDHIYRATYDKMLDKHIENNADCTVMVINVEPKEASRFGIMSVDEDYRITQFEEKPKNPKSTLASMGIYIFTYKLLRQELLADSKKEDSEHDFGKNILPNLLSKKKRLFAYPFEGYWRDVGTIGSLHQANMDILDPVIWKGVFGASDDKIYTEDTASVPQYVGRNASIKDSIVNQGAIILGSANRCVIANEVIVEKGATLESCVVMRGAYIGRNAHVRNAIIAPYAQIEAEKKININKKKDIVLIK